MIERYMDGTGRIRNLPKNRSKRLVIYEYLTSKFDAEREYSEKEVNEIISQNHLFNDTCLLRRELVDHGFLIRKDNGTCYRVSNNEEAE